MEVHMPENAGAPSRTVILRLTELDYFAIRDGLETLNPDGDAIETVDRAARMVNEAWADAAPRLPGRRHSLGPGTAAQFGVDESRLADLAARYPVNDDHGAFLALEAAILGDDGNQATAVITGGPCDLAVEALADANGEVDGYRLLIHPATDLAAPWTASHVERVSDRDTLAEPTRDGGTYDTAEIIRDAATLANELLTWSGQ
jgi:hypothetical protein